MPVLPKFPRRSTRDIRMVHERQNKSKPPTRRASGVLAFFGFF